MRQSRQPLRLPPIRIMEDILRFYLTTVRHELIADSQLAFSHSNCRRTRGWRRVRLVRCWHSWNARRRKSGPGFSYTKAELLLRWVRARRLPFLAAEGSV